MYKQNKPIRASITIKARVWQRMKDYLQQLNDEKSLKYVSQSEFISEAITQLLDKELNNER